jgi:hypothetical protein
LVIDGVSVATQGFWQRLVTRCPKEDHETFAQGGITRLSNPLNTAVLGAALVDRLPRTLAVLKGILVWGAVFAIALPAHATLMVTVKDPMVPGTNPCSNNNADNGTGTFNLTCLTDPNFAVINTFATGSTGTSPAILPQPGLSTTQLSVTSLAADTLEIDITQTGLNFAGGVVTVSLGFSTLAAAGTTMTLEADAPDGHLLFMDTQMSSGITTNSPPITVPPLTSDSAKFFLTFTGPGQVTSATISINPPQPPPPVPEPASLTLLGTALVGLGWFARRRRAGPATGA